MMKRTKKVAKKRNPMQTTFTRFMLIVAFFILWIGAIGVRLVHLQVNQSEWLRDRAQSQRRDQSKSRTLRGTIFDRTERTLAMSVKVKSLYADPREIEDVESTAQKIADGLKIKPDGILNDLRAAQDGGKRFVWLARKVDEETVIKLNLLLETPELKKFDLPKFKGLYWREEQKRSYPYKTLAAQVVGFSNADDVGQAGIEQSQENILRGMVVKKWQDRDRLGRVYDESETEEAREPPKDIVLTISHSIQYKVEEALKSGVKAAAAKSGMAIVLDPKTGEILAMANYPTFDPNNFAAFPTENYNNKAVQSSHAPGSVFKLVTYGAALNEKLIKPDEWFSCGNGTIEVGNHEFKDPHCGRAISFTKALAISSNLGAIKTGLKVGENKFNNYIRQFGFGEMTGIELPAETRGLVRPLESWNADSLASMSIGYEIGVTALQTTLAFATIANDGVRVRPHIIKEIRQADGKVISAATPEKTRVVSAEAAASLRKMLREVVLTGTGKEAALNGYSSAGKTGTAWKFDPKIKRVSGSKYTSSFVGFAPAENPSVVIAVVMDEPKGALRNGGQVSAPVFREIARQILPEMSVVPDANIVQDDLTAENIPSEIEAQPSLPEQIESENILNDLPKKEELKKVSKTSVENQKSKAIKETRETKAEIKKETKKEDKKENKLPSEDKKSPKPKSNVVNAETKNKSSTEKGKKKT
ncbi:MAG: penicillin-binding protein 2 [Acidobacteria bacterium]|nr:penicillin-binding protein 2 [Acidobacteriota bacterium]